MGKDRFLVSYSLCFLEGLKIVDFGCLSFPSFECRIVKVVYFYWILFNFMCISDVFLWDGIETTLGASPLNLTSKRG